MTRGMVSLLTTASCGMAGFYALLSVVPLSTAYLGASDFESGLSFGAMMVSTVLMELAVPLLLSTCGYRWAMALGLVLLGLPAAALAMSPPITVIVVLSLVRGAGLGILVVVGTALAAEIVMPDRRAEALGVYGLAVGVPAVVCLPLGVWLSDRVGFGPVFLGASALPLIAVPLVGGLPSTRPRPHRGRGVLSGLRDTSLSRPTFVFSAFTVASGVLVTFLPLAMADRDRNVVVLALLVQASAAPLARVFIGRFGHRIAARPALLLSVVTGAIGMAGLMRLDSAATVLIGAGLFGTAFGVAQNVTIAVMFDRVDESEFGRVSALWNVAYDSGMGFGAVGIGLVLGFVAYPAAFALTACLMLTAMVPAWRDRHMKSTEEIHDD